MSLEGLKLAALYSYDCRKARMFRINELLAKFIKTGEEQERTVEALKKLVSYAWYCLIAKNNEIKDPFVEEVVGAYWTGNDLTKLISVQGKNLFLFHNFTVLTSPMPDLISRDECKSSWGMIKEATEDDLMVDYEALIWQNDKFSLEDREIRIKKGFLDRVQVNNWISFHVGLGRQILTEEQVLVLHNKTKEAIELFNAQSASQK